MASITLTFTASEATRIQDAMTEILRLETPATTDDYKDYLISKTKQLVKTAERKVAERALVPNPDVDIT